MPDVNAWIQELRVRFHRGERPEVVFGHGGSPVEVDYTEWDGLPYAVVPFGLTVENVYAEIEGETFGALVGFRFPLFDPDDEEYG